MVTNNLYGLRIPVIGGLVVAVMPGPAAMAVAIAGGISDYSWLYAAGAAWIRLILLGMWLIPRWAAASSISPWCTVAYNLVTVAIWLVSIAVPAPFNYVLWIVAVGAEFTLLAFRSRFASEVYDRTSVSHALECIGLIVCAMLARAFFRWGIPAAEAGLEAPQQAQAYGALRDVVMYISFLLIIGLMFVAATIGISVVDAESPLAFGVRVLLAVEVAILYLANAAIGLRLRRSARRIALLLVPSIVLPAVACLSSATLAAWVTLALVALALVTLDVVSLLLGRTAADAPSPAHVL